MSAASGPQYPARTGPQRAPSRFDAMQNHSPRRRALRLATIVAPFLAPALAAQTTVDLSSWSSETYDASGFGDGLWTPAPDGSSVVQSVNGDPTFFVGDFSTANTIVEGKIEVLSSGGDNDLIGFAIGFQPGDTTNPAADYLLIDWKQGTQGYDFGDPSCTPSSTSDVGLAISRVTGIPTADELWGHENFDATCSDLANGVVELQRATNLGSTGWSTGQEYTFRFEVSTSRVTVYVDGNQELDVFGTFPDGRICFYNFSQANVEYSAFTLACPAVWYQGIAGWPGTNGTPSLTISANPVMGTTVDLTISNSYGQPTDAFLLQSRTSAQVATQWGGTFALGTPFFVSRVVSPLPAGGGTVSIPIPDDSALCGTEHHVQAFVLDPGASHGVAFTNSIQAIVGQ